MPWIVCRIACIYTITAMNRQALQKKKFNRGKTSDRINIELTVDPFCVDRSSFHNHDDDDFIIMMMMIS